MKLLEAARTLTKTQVASVSYLAQKIHAKYTLTLESLIKRYDVHLWLTFEDAFKRSKFSQVREEHTVSKLIALGHSYIELAAALGYERALRDLLSAGYIVWFAHPVKAPFDSYSAAFEYNDRYLKDSFGPFAMGQGEAVDAKARLSLYSHYLWRVAEAAYRYCLKQYQRETVRSKREAEGDAEEDFLSVFAGPDDAETCNGCDGAVQGNPYPISECPEPGEFECMGRCRHFVQLSQNAPDDLAPYEWHGLIGFGSVPGKYYEDVVRDQDLLPRWQIDRYRLDSPYEPSIDGLSLPSEGSVLGKLGVGPLFGPSELPAASALTQLPATSDMHGLAKWLWDAGLAVDEVSDLLGLTADQLSELHSQYDDIQDSEATTATVLTWLRQGKIAKLVGLAENPVFDAIYNALADIGFAASDSTMATTLGQVLGVEPYFDPETGTWMFGSHASGPSQESAREVGGPGSGDFGHRDVPGKRGGSAPSGKPSKAELRKQAVRQRAISQLEKGVGLSREQMKRNIEKALDEATPGERKNGMDWYEKAHAKAEEFAKKYNVTVEQAAGVIAATSPQKAWELNLKSAEQVIANPDISKYKEYAITRVNFKKAIDILNGKPVMSVLGQLDKYPKTPNFFHNILDPSDPQWITIDRHAVQLAVGREMSKGDVKLALDGGAGAKYNYYADLYREVATERNTIPNDVQAISWTHWTVNHARAVDRDLLRLRGIAESHIPAYVFETPKQVPHWPDFMQPYTTDPDYAQLVGLEMREVRVHITSIEPGRTIKILHEVGTAASGDRHHAGRPGVRGGSAPGGGAGEKKPAVRKARRLKVVRSVAGKAIAKAGANTLKPVRKRRVAVAKKEVPKKIAVAPEEKPAAKEKPAISISKKDETTKVLTSLQNTEVKSEHEVRGGHISETKKLVLSDGTVAYFKSGEMDPDAREEIGTITHARDNIEPGMDPEREVAAYQVAQLVGMDDLAMPTTFRTYNGVRGSIQLGAKGEIAVRSDNMYDGEKDAARTAAFDFVIGNEDRHGKNWIVDDSAKAVKANDGQPKLQLIDHGLSFPDEGPYSFNEGNQRFVNKYTDPYGGRTERPELQPNKLAAPYVKNVDEIASTLKQVGLNDEAIQGVRDRITVLAQTSKWSDLRNNWSNYVNSRVYGQPSAEHSDTTSIPSGSEIAKHEEPTFDSSGYNVEGFNASGQDRQGYNQAGFNSAGYDRQGYDRSGFNADGFNKQGYDRFGFTVGMKDYNPNFDHRVVKHLGLDKFAVKDWLSNRPDRNLWYWEQPQ